MRLLLAVFAFDPVDPVLSWQHRVTSALAARCREVTVLAERSARAAPRPPNVEVIQAPATLLRAPGRWLGSRSLLRGWAERRLRGRHFDAGFVHMAHEWAPRLAPLLHRERAPLLLWYAHGSVDEGLRRAVAAAEAVVTSTPDGCRIADPKIRVIGQGIDLGLYSIASGGSRDEIVCTGRIAPRKRLDLIIDAFALANRDPRGKHLRLRLVGPSLSAADRAHAADLRRRADALGIGGRVSIEPAVPPSEIAMIHARAVLHVNCSATGSMDKTVLEALACGVPVLTTNEAFRAFLGECEPAMALKDDRREAVAAGILAWLDRPVDREAYRAMVERQHGLDRWADAVVSLLVSLRQPS